MHNSTIHLGRTGPLGFTGGHERRWCGSPLCCTGRCCGAADDGVDAVDGGGEPVGWVRGVAEDQPGQSGVVAVPRQGVHEDPGVTDPVGEDGVVGGVGQLREGDEQVQPGGDPLDPGGGQGLVQGGEDGVAAAALAGPDQS